MNLHIDEGSERGRQVLDVHPGASVHLGRVLAGEQGDPHRSLQLDRYGPEAPGSACSRVIRP